MIRKYVFTIAMFVLTLFISVDNIDIINEISLPFLFKLTSCESEIGNVIYVTNLAAIN